MTINGLRQIATSLALIMTVAFVVRAAFAIDQMRRIPSPALENAAFDNEAGSIGRSLASGRGFSSPYNRETGPTAILPPLYPLLVAGVFKLWGTGSAASFRVLCALNILFATLASIPVYRAGQQMGGVRLGSRATWLWALFPNGILIPFEWIWETSLSALLAATLLWLTLRLAGRSSLRRWAGYGFLWGVALMTNPALAAALPVLLWWALRAGELDSRAWQKAALVLAIAMACAIPWTVRNYAVFHRLVPLRSGFAFELYIGNNENYAEPRVFPPRVSYERELVRYVHMGEMPFMDEERRKALAFLRAYPRTAARLMSRRVASFWIGTAAPFDALKSSARLVDRLILLSNLLVPIVSIGGLVRLALARSRYFPPLAAFPVAFPLVYYLTHASLRYRHAIDPVLFLLAAALFTPVIFQSSEARVSHDETKSQAGYPIGEQLKELS
jgi:hypothetical protein